MLQTARISYENDSPSAIRAAFDQEVAELAASDELLHDDAREVFQAIGNDDWSSISSFSDESLEILLSLAAIGYHRLIIRQIDQEAFDSQME